MQKKEYKTNWGFADKQNIDKTFFEMLQQSMENTNLFRNKQLFFQYVILLYIGGKRRIEPFLMPVTISEYREEGIRYFEIKSGLAKHFGSGRNSVMQCNACHELFRTSKERKAHTEANKTHIHYSHVGNRDYVESAFIADNSYELAMFQYLLQGRQKMIIDFTPLLPPKFQKMNLDTLLNMEFDSSLFSAITKRFRIFKLPITNGSIVEENNSIVPHMLRHMRAYDMKVIHSYSNSFIQKVFGWKKEDMISYYTDILHSLKLQDQLAELRQRKNMQMIGGEI
jgi:integrase